MRIIVESLGIPSLSDVIGKKAEVYFEGGTIADLVDQLVGRLGAKDRGVLVDGKGRLDPSIQVMLNEEGSLAREELPKRGLKDGDHNRLVPLVCGG